MQWKYICAVLLLALMSGPTQLVWAHGNSYSYEETKDGYTIDVGHDEFIAVGESMRFDFAVYPQDIDSVEGEVYTDVWVTLTKEKKIFFAGGIHKPVFGATGFTFVFPEEGEYVMTVRYQKDGDTVVATEFPLSILPPLEEKSSIPPMVIGGITAVAALLLGIGVGLFIPRKKQKEVV